VSAISIIVIILVVIVVAALAIASFGPMARRRRLREQFGPEYDRVVTEQQSRRLGEAELSSRQRRVEKFQLQELSDDAWARYSAQWAQVQERFVDGPPEAVAEAQELVESVMRERGYPVANYDQTLADLSVDHARVLDRFRSAHAISEKATSGQASTEELRTAMLYYRELFEQLLARESVPGAAHPEMVPGAAQSQEPDPQE
jgi:hypothetical protein